MSTTTDDHDITEPVSMMYAFLKSNAIVRSLVRGLGPLDVALLLFESSPHQEAIEHCCIITRDKFRVVIHIYCRYGYHPHAQF